MYSFCYHKTIELLQDLAWPHHKVNNTKNPSLSQATKNKIKPPTLYIYIDMCLQMGFWSQVLNFETWALKPKKRIGREGGGLGSTCDVSLAHSSLQVASLSPSV